MPVHQASLICGFCKQGTEANEICGTLHKGFLKDGSTCGAHHRCMQYSYFLGQYKFKRFGGFKIAEVQKELKRAKKLKCASCKLKNIGGASAKCGYCYCNRSFHYYCVQNSEKCSARRICIRRQKSSQPIILYRIFCSAKHEKRCIDRGFLFQEAFDGLDSDEDNIDYNDSSGDESENDFELIEDIFKQKKARKLAQAKLSPKPKPVQQSPKTLSRAERFKIRERLLKKQESEDRHSKSQNIKDDHEVRGQSVDEGLCTKRTQKSNHPIKEDTTNASDCKEASMTSCNNNKLTVKNCPNLHPISKMLNNRILSVTLEKLSDNVFNMKDKSITSKNGYCIQNIVGKRSNRTEIVKKTPQNNNNGCCRVSSVVKSESEKKEKKEEIDSNNEKNKNCKVFYRKNHRAKRQKQESVVKISGSCQKLVKEVRKGLFGDPVGAWIEICLEKLPLDLCLQGSVNLLDQKSNKFTGAQKAITNLSKQSFSVKKAKSLPSTNNQGQTLTSAQTETCSEENNSVLENPEVICQNASELLHQNSILLDNVCSEVELSTEKEPTLINLTNPEEISVGRDEEENGSLNLQVETLSLDLTNCIQPSSSPHIMSAQDQETMVLCICRNRKCDLQSQSRILRICKNRYQASKMNIFFWHDIMPSSFKPEYLPYFFLDIVECLRLKMYEVFFTLLFRFDQKHSEKFQYLIDIEDDSVIKEQENNIWTTVASCLKKASLESGKEVGILMSLEEQEVMLLPINEVNDRSCKIRRQLLRLRSQSQVMDASIQDVSQEAYTLKSWLQVNLQERYQVYYKPDDDVISLSDMESSCTNQLYVYLKQHALNTATMNGVGFSKLNMLDVTDKMDYVLCIGSVNTDIVNYLNYCEKALLQFITNLEDRCNTIYCILDIGEARGISQAFQILPKNEIWQGQVEVFSAVVPGAKQNFCVILKIVPSSMTSDNGNSSQTTEKCKKRLADVSSVVHSEKKAKF